MNTITRTAAPLELPATASDVAKGRVAATQGRFDAHLERAIGQGAGRGAGRDPDRDAGRPADGPGRRPLDRPVERDVRRRDRGPRDAVTDAAATPPSTRADRTQQPDDALVAADRSDDDHAIDDHADADAIAIAHAIEGPAVPVVAQPVVTMPAPSAAPGVGDGTPTTTVAEVGAVGTDAASTSTPASAAIPADAAIPAAGPSVAAEQPTAVPVQAQAAQADVAAIDAPASTDAPDPSTVAAATGEAPSTDDAIPSVATPMSSGARPVAAEGGDAPEAEAPAVATTFASAGEPGSDGAPGDTARDDGSKPSTTATTERVDIGSRESTSRTGPLEELSTLAQPSAPRTGDPGDHLGPLTVPRMSMDLSDEGLGPLTLQALSGAGVVHLKLTAGDRQVGEALARAGDELRRELEAGGTRLGSLDIGHGDVGHGDAGRGDSHARQSNWRPAPASDRRAPGLVGGAVTAAATAPTPSPRVVDTPALDLLI